MLTSTWNGLGFVLKTTRFNDSESTLSFERQQLYTRCTFRFKTLQDVFIHLELCYTLHERSFSKIHNGGNILINWLVFNWTLNEIIFVSYIKKIIFQFPVLQYSPQPLTVHMKSWIEAASKNINRVQNEHSANWKKKRVLVSKSN